MRLAVWEFHLGETGTVFIVMFVFGVGTTKTVGPHLQLPIFIPNTAFDATATVVQVTEHCHSGC